MQIGTAVSRGYLASADGVRGRVLARFARCAYVAVDGGPALVVHAAGGDHTPTSICPAVWPPAGSAVEIGDPVAGRAGHLKIGALVLDIRGARVWRPLAAPVLTASLADSAIATAYRPALRAASLANCAIATAHRPALQAASRRTGELLCALERALSRRDADHVADRVASLVGRGPGLTPSGDDALVGLLAVLHRFAPAGDRSLELLCPAVTAHLHRTGDISAHYLRLAVGGHFGEPLIALCDALAAVAGHEVDAAAVAVLATGATSGADALLGVVTAIRLVAATGADHRAVAA